jgi:hypothetical protein
MAIESKSEAHSSRIRVPVVDERGVPLMPCTAPKARALLKSGQARPKRNMLGLFYVQLMYEQEPNNQPLVAGIDPGSSFEGFSVVGTKETVCNMMVEAPTHVKNAVATRRSRRRARRFRLWRRPCRFQNRNAGRHQLPPSTRARWEAKARIVRHPRYGLCAIGGCDRTTGCVSLHAYRTNTRLTQAANPAACQRLTRVAFRSWLVGLTTSISGTMRRRTGRTKGAALPPQA